MLRDEMMSNVRAGKQLPWYFSSLLLSSSSSSSCVKYSGVQIDKQVMKIEKKKFGSAKELNQLLPNQSTSLTGRGL